MSATESCTVVKKSRINYGGDSWHTFTWGMLDLATVDADYLLSLLFSGCSPKIFFSEQNYLLG